MTTFLPGPLILKEGRALAPIWLGAVVTVVAAAKTGELLLALVAFVLGAAALGVFSIGHEYAHRTLTMFLAQPLTRSRLLLSKVVVLAPLLVLLGVIAAVVLLRADGTDRVLGESTLGARWRLAVIVLTPVLGLCVAPWLTMVCRSVMAGFVFTLAIPAGLWTAGQIARAVATDFDVATYPYSAVDRLAYGPALTLMIVGMVIVSVVAAVHGRALFVGLEALDAPRNLIPATPATSPVAATGESRVRNRRSGLGHRPLVQLVRKEVRLQGLAFAVAGLYTLSWIALSLARTEQYIAGQSFADLTRMYGMFIALLVGAVSSAEERSMGTNEWQILQPWAFWKQWLVKLLTISLLALLLGLAVPMGLEAAFPLIVDSGRVGPRLPLYLWLPFDSANGPSATILLITLFSAYASTLCVGGLRALLVALPLSFGLVSLYFNVIYALYRLELVTHSFKGPIVRVRFLWQEGWMTANFADLLTASRVSEWIDAAMFAGFVLGVLYLSLRNSRSAERGTSIAKKQLPWVIAYVAFAAVLGRASEAFLEWWFLTH